MHFEKALRRRLLPPDPLGYEEPEAKQNTGAPLLKTQDRLPLNPFEGLEKHQWPEEILMKVLWRPLPVNQRGPVVQSCVPDFEFAPTQYYAPESTGQNPMCQYVCQGVELMFEGLLTEMRKNINVNLKPGECLGVISFSMQDAAAKLVLRRRSLPSGKWLVTPPKKPEMAGVNLLPLLTYAGVAKPGGGIERVEQVFAQIAHKGDLTQISLKTYGDLLEKKVPPPYGGRSGRARVIYVDSYPNQNPLSLKNAILSGHISVSCSWEGDLCTYRSVGFLDEIPSQNRFVLKLTNRT